MKKTLIILTIFSMTISAQAGWTILFNKDSGRIDAHTEKKVIIDGNNVKCGKVEATVKWNAMAIGTVASWVNGASNTNQLGAVTVIEHKAQQADYDNWEPFMKARWKAFTILINRRLGTNKITKLEFETELEKLLD